jgi:D-3-phosphoglycerate dehydrogenase
VTARVVVTDHAFAGTRHEQAVASAHRAQFSEHSCTDEAQTIDALTDADVAFVNFAPMTRRVLSTMKPGSTVIRYGIGVDNVDLEAARDHGIRIANVPDYGVETVADHAAAGLLALMRRLHSYDRAIRAHGWVSPTGLGPVRSIRQHTVGFLGFGRIAQAVHRRLAPFGPKFIAYDPFCPSTVFDSLGVDQVDLETLARRTSALSVHAPLTPDTENVVDAAFLARMPDDAVIVNTARGGLIDERTLAEALSNGRLGGALLDVTRPEPVPADSPLRAVDGLVLTPHAAFYDEQSLDNLQRLASEEAGRALRGEALRCPVA